MTQDSLRTTMTVVVHSATAQHRAKRTTASDPCVIHPSRLPRKKRRCPCPESPRTVSPLPGSSGNSSNSNKRVRFSTKSDRVQVRNATTDDLSQSWLHEKDYCAYRQDCLSELRRFLRRSKDDKGGLQRVDAPQEQHCTRGLEILINRVAYGQATQRDVVRHIVHQYRLQRKHGRDDTPTLRHLSLQFSQPDTIRAQQLALADQDDAKSYRACPES